MCRGGKNNYRSVKNICKGEMNNDQEEKKNGRGIENIGRDE